MTKTFEESVQDFKLINSNTAEQLISKEQEFILFLGRSSCPFCRKFAPKMNEVSKKINKEVHFINSEDFDDIDLDTFRNKYSIKTVPGLLVSKNGNVKVVCDSSLPVEAIISFINE